MDINRPVAKFTASIAILLTLGATFLMMFNQIPIPEAGVAIISGIVSSAGTFLFLSEKIA